MLNLFRHNQDLFMGEAYPKSYLILYLFLPPQIDIEMEFFQLDFLIHDVFRIS